jgi:hypothetical protein
LFFSLGQSSQCLLLVYGHMQVTLWPIQ